MGNHTHILPWGRGAAGEGALRPREHLGTAHTTPQPSGVVVYGQNWCPDCVRAESALSGLGVPFHYVDAGVGDARIVKIQGAARRAQGRSPNSTPCVTSSDGSHLTTPSKAELKKCEELKLLAAA